MANTLRDTVQTSGVLAANGDVVQLAVAGYGTCAIDVRGTFSLTIQIEGTVDGVNWTSLTAGAKVGAVNTAASGSLGAVGLYQVDVTGLSGLRARCSAWVSGSATVFLEAAQGSAVVQAFLLGSPAVAISGASTTATGAGLVRHAVAANGTNATNVKNAPGRVLGWFIANTTASWRYVKLHNLAVAPTAGASVAMAIAVPPNDIAPYANPVGIGFTTGIGFTMVTGSADADATAVVAGDIIMELLYA